MNYIINPSWFYWLSVCDAVKGVSIALAIVMAISTIVMLICVVDNELFEDEELKKIKKCFRFTIIATIVCLLLAVFIPNKTTLLEMQIARMATKENVGWTVEQIRSIVDYIVEAGKALK